MPYKAEDFTDIRRAWQIFADSTPIPHNMDQADAYFLYTQGAVTGVGILCQRLAEIADSIRDDPDGLRTYLANIGETMKEVTDDMLAETRRAQSNQHGPRG